MMKKLILGVVALMALTFTACEDDDVTYISIDFNTDGGSYVYSQNIEEGNFIVEPENPTKQNSAFNGWFLNDSIFDFSLPVDTNITLLAKWTTTDGNMYNVGFENIMLNAAGLAQNDSISGSIVSGDLSVSCSWFGTYGSGFSVSNHTDITTAGYTNPYSCIAGSGANNSENFATYNRSSDSIKFNSLVDLESIMLCNNTYAYLSMKNGDAYAKKFDAGDYFKLTLEMYAENGTTIGSEDFYLADFRDGKSVIVKEWTKLDNTFKGVSYIKFSFESTDNGDWGMNTPAYFCIDDIKYYEAE